MTDFVINLAEQYLLKSRKSLIEYGQPCGLMALILVAVSIETAILLIIH
jgi:hypothetical protein